MKIKNLFYPLVFAIDTIAGFFIGGFYGGFMAGAGAMLFLFATIGKLMARKTTRQIDAAIKTKRDFYNNMKD